MWMQRQVCMDHQGQLVLAYSCSTPEAAGEVLVFVGSQEEIILRREPAKANMDPAGAVI
jgi:hypothetical protein